MKYGSIYPYICGVFNETTINTFNYTKKTGGKILSAVTSKDELRVCIMLTFTLLRTTDIYKLLKFSVDIGGYLRMLASGMIYSLGVFSKIKGSMSGVRCFD